MRRTISLIIILSLLIPITFLSCKKKEEVIKIGAILPLTGDGAKYGEEDKNGISLATMEINKAGGINGSKVEVIFEDSLGLSLEATKAAKKLIITEKVPVILGLMFSSTALAVAPLGNKYKIVIFSTTASSPVLTEAGDYFFRNWPSDVYEGSEMAKFSFNQLNLKKIAILSINLDYGAGLTKVFSQVFESLGGKITSIEYYDQSATDYRTQLNKIKDKNPEAIYLPGYYSEIGLILRQAKEMKIKIQFLSCVGFDNPKILEIAGDSAERVIFSRPFYDPGSEKEHIKNFVDSYKNKFHTEPGIYAAHAYDAVNIVAEAIKSGGYTAEGIKNSLYETRNYPGVTGKTSFNKNGDVIKPIQIMKVQNGRFKRYK